MKKIGTLIVLLLCCTTYLSAQISEDYEILFTDENGHQDVMELPESMMLSELDRNMPKSVKYTRPEGGLFIWCTLPGGISSDAFVKEALKRKVAVVPGTAFNCDTEAPSDSFRLNYSMPSDDEIVTGVGRLSALAREMF